MPSSHGDHNAVRLTATSVVVGGSAVSAASLDSSFYSSLRAGGVDIAIATANTLAVTKTLSCQSNIEVAGRVLDSGGHSIVHGAYYQSGNPVLDNEVMRIPIQPFMFCTDDGTGVPRVVDGGTSVLSFTTVKSAGGMKQGSGAQEMIVYLPSIPENWVCFGIYLSLLNQSPASTPIDEDISVFTKSVLDTSAPYGVVNLLTSGNTGCNALKILSTVIRHDGFSNSFVCIETESTTPVFCGGFCQIRYEGPP